MGIFDKFKPNDIVRFYLFESIPDSLVYGKIDKKTTFNKEDKEDVLYKITFQYYELLYNYIVKNFKDANLKHIARDTHDTTTFTAYVKESQLYDTDFKELPQLEQKIPDFLFNTTHT